VHCDDKRTLFVLKQGIEETWEELKKTDFGDKGLIEKLSEEIQEYFEYKNSPSN
jgi:predicted house-cleaning noncanonical NTP pyrophosphatase (MazG superfamily)